MLQRKSSPTCQRICSTHGTQERAMSVQMHAYRPPHHLCRPEQRKGITCAHITDMHTARRAHSTSTRIQPPAPWPRAQNALHRSRARTHMQEPRPRHGRRHSDGHSHEHGPPSASSGIKVGGPGHLLLCRSKNRRETFIPSSDFCVKVISEKNPKLKTRIRLLRTCGKFRSAENSNSKSSLRLFTLLKRYRLIKQGESGRGCHARCDVAQ